MSPDVQMVCEKCHAVRLVKEILFLTNGLIEIECLTCGNAQVYGVKK